MNLILSNFNTFFLFVWALFLVVVAIRLARPVLIKNISYRIFILGAIGIHVGYASSATLLQYLVWHAPLASGSANELGKMFLTMPLSSEVPFPLVFEWVRPVFSGAHGYFAMYSFQHFFLSTVALFFVTALFVLFFKTYEYYRPASFMEGDIAIIAIAFLVSGWLGAIVLVPLALILAVAISLVSLVKTNLNPTSLSLSFLIVSPFALLFATPILKYLNLYLLLKL